MPYQPNYQGYAYGNNSNNGYPPQHGYPQNDQYQGGHQAPQSQPMHGQAIYGAHGQSAQMPVVNGGRMPQQYTHPNFAQRQESLPPSLGYNQQYAPTQYAAAPPYQNPSQPSYPASYQGSTYQPPQQMPILPLPQIQHNQAQANSAFAYDAQRRAQLMQQAPAQHRQPPPLLQQAPAQHRQPPPLQQQAPVQLRQPLPPQQQPQFYQSTHDDHSRRASNASSGFANSPVPTSLETIRRSQPPASPMLQQQAQVHSPQLQSLRRPSNSASPNPMPAVLPHQAQYSQARPQASMNHVQHRPSPLQASATLPSPYPTASPVTRPLSHQTPTHPAQHTSPPLVQDVKAQPYQSPTTQSPLNLNTAPSATRKIVNVAIPVQRRTPSLPVMAPPVKRRKSNDTAPLPIYSTDVSSQPSTAIQPSSLQKSNPTMMSSSPLSVLPSSQIPLTPPSLPTVDYQATLLALSDEYIRAAYNVSLSLAGDEVSEEQLEEYYSLLSTGMSCLESVLNNYRIPDARKEARIRLRLASLMYEETENDMDAEAILAKGIALCERARLTDLKYSMHHLLARIWFKGNQAKAAMKAVEKLMDEVEKLQLPHWEFAFRFLRVSFGFQVETFPTEAVSLVKHLSALYSTAQRHRNAAVQIVAGALEALIHLRTRSPDSVDLAQRALAAARTNQLSPEMEAMPQARALLDCVDLACQLVRYAPDQVNAKLASLRANLDSYYEDSGQSKEGEWVLPLIDMPKISSNIDSDTGGILSETETGMCGLTFTWLTRTQATSLGFLLSALSGMQHKHNPEHKPDSLLGEGLNINKVSLEKMRMSLSTASERAGWQHEMRITLQSYLVFSYCARAEWEKAMKGLGNIRSHIAKSGSAPSSNLRTLIAYLEATCKHGLGNLAPALEQYNSPDLCLPAAHDAKAFTTSGSAPIRILAALNTVPILRKFGAFGEAEARLERLEPLCNVAINSNGFEHGSKALESAFYVLKATALSTSSHAGSEHNSILKTKQYLQSAISAAQRVTNDRLLTLVMNHMTHLFFANIVGRQAEQSATVGRQLAKKCGDRLWVTVADGMLADTLERGGADAAAVRSEGKLVWEGLPSSLKNAVFQ